MAGRLCAHSRPGGLVYDKEVTPAALAIELLAKRGEGGGVAGRGGGGRGGGRERERVR